MLHVLHFFLTQWVDSVFELPIYFEGLGNPQMVPELNELPQGSKSDYPKTQSL